MTTTPKTTHHRVRITTGHAAPDDNPRNWETKAGVMVLSHRRNLVPCESHLHVEVQDRLSDPQYGQTATERIDALSAWLIEQHGASVVLPVWGYDHGGLRLKAGERTPPFDDRFDSGLLGVIYDTPQTREDTQIPEAKMAEWLTGEVATYDQWVNNELYGWTVERYDGEDWTVVASKDGYYVEADARHDGKDFLVDLFNEERPAGTDARHGSQTTPPARPRTARPRTGSPTP